MLHIVTVDELEERVVWTLKRISALRKAEIARMQAEADKWHKFNRERSPAWNGLPYELRQATLKQEREARG
jgi:uncharacterized small protein (DUF1192 family)